MKKIIFAAAALSLATFAFAPVAASAAPMRDAASVARFHPHHRPHCKVVKSKVRVGHRWVVRTRKICR